MRYFSQKDAVLFIKRCGTFWEKMRCFFPNQDFNKINMISRIIFSTEFKASPNPSEGGEQTRRKALRPYMPSLFPPLGTSAP